MRAEVIDPQAQCIKHRLDDSEAASGVAMTWNSSEMLRLTDWIFGREPHTMGIIPTVWGNQH